ncbi:IS4 family transposase [Alkalihalobacillus sp. FSL W8-0930]
MSLKEEFSTFAKTVLDVLSVPNLRQSARDVGFVQRLKKLKPEDFLSICAFLPQPVGSTELTQLCGALSRESNTQLSKQALHQRFDEKGAAFLKHVFFQLAGKQEVIAMPPLPETPFSRIRILDATSFERPRKEGTSSDGAKIHLEYELYEGKFLHTLLCGSRESDHHAAYALADTIQPGDLIIRDLGYFSGDHLKQIDRAGASYITRTPANMTYWTRDDQGERIQIKPEEDAKQLEPGAIKDYGVIQLGVKGKNTLQTRVIVQRLTEDQQNKRKAGLRKRRRKGGHTQSADKKDHTQILATNLTQEEMDVQALYPMYSLRWQVEILFKTWKSLFAIDHVRAMNPDRFLCHMYGKLIHILLSSMVAFQCRFYLHQKHHLEGSEYKCIHHAKRAIEESKGYALYHRSSLEDVLENIYENIYRYGRKDHRHRHQSPYDILQIAYETHARME